MVAIDQRGTGATRCDCPALQDADGRLGPDAADARGGHGLRARRSARAALLQHRGHGRGPRGAADRARRPTSSRSTGRPTAPTSAQRYALAHPERVRGLVLDSVVPVGERQPALRGPDQGHRGGPGQQATKDLAEVVREHATGPEMLDLLTALGRGAARQRAATRSRRPPTATRARSKALIRRRRATSWTADTPSGSARACTRARCAPTRPRPWGDAAAPLEGREQALDERGGQAQRRGPLPLRPRDRDRQRDRAAVPELAAGRRRRAAGPAAELPDVPTVLLAGDKDLSTPMEWAQQAAKRAPQRRADHRRGRRPRRPGPGRPRGARGGTRPLASLG